MDEHYTAVCLLGLSQQEGNNSELSCFKSSSAVCGNSYHEASVQNLWIGDETLASGEYATPGQHSVRRRGKFSPQERMNMRYVFLCKDCARGCW